MGANAQIVVSIILLATSLQSYAARDTDPLKGIARCIDRKPYQAVETSRLPATSISRTVTTPDGDREISLEDGYRMLIAIHKVPFVNLKIEKSIASAFESDREIVMQQMRGYFKDTPQFASDLTLSKFGDVEMVELYHRDPERPSSSMVTFFVAKSSLIATAYILNPGDGFKSVAAYESAKVDFADHIRTCLASQ